MRLYLLRHGEAEKAHHMGVSDHARPLTEDAVAALDQAAHRMALTIGHFDRILASPLVRAIETADIVSSAFGHFPVPELVDELNGEFDTDVVASLFANMVGDPTMLLVGHAPGLDELVRYLVAPEELQPITHMQPGTLARVDLELPLRRKAILQWLVPLEAW
jgi:phosphohistidine phosphatase